MSLAEPSLPTTSYGALRPQEMYHLAPIEARASIASNGLGFHAATPRSRARQYAEAGNYLWNNYASTFRYRAFWANREFDLYKVTTDGLTLLPDPLNVPGAFLTTDHIPPSRLTRVVLNLPSVADPSVEI